jgi:hypothetical protein
LRVLRLRDELEDRLLLLERLVDRLLDFRFEVFFRPRLPFVSPA